MSSWFTHCSPASVPVAMLVLLGCTAPAAMGSSTATTPEEADAVTAEEVAPALVYEPRVHSTCTYGLDQYDRDTGAEDCYANLPACIAWCEAGDAPSCLALANNAYGMQHPELVERLCVEGYLHACVVLARERWRRNDEGDEVACAGERLSYACDLGSRLACFTRAFYLRTGNDVVGIDESFLQIACERHSDALACGAWAAFHETGEFGLTASPARAREIRAGYCHRRPEECERNSGSPYALDAEVIRVVVRYHLPEVVECYEPYVTTHQGTLTVQWVIGPDGQVTDATALHSLHPPIDDCVLERVRTWRFPPPSGGGVVSVTYPFSMSRSP